MATYGGSSDVSAGYTLSSGPGSSTDVSTRSSPVAASHLKGLGYVSIYQFKGIQDLQKRIEKGLMPYETVAQLTNILFSWVSQNIILLR